jgi:hypothetical protein
MKVSSREISGLTRRFFLKKRSSEQVALTTMCRQAKELIASLEDV